MRVYVCVCIMYARVYAYVMCVHDEPFSYLISFYSSSRIVLFVIARTAQCFRFRYTVTFQLSVYLATLCCVSTTRQEKHGVVGRSRNRAKLTSKESQEKNESMPFPFFLSFFLSFLIYLPFFPTGFAPVSIYLVTFSFREDQKRPSEQSWRGRDSKGKAIRAHSRREGGGGGNIEADHRTVTRPESNSIRSLGIQFATRLLCPPGTNQIHSFARRVSFPFRFPPRFIDARDSRETDSFDRSFFFLLKRLSIFVSTPRYSKTIYRRN